MYTESSHVMSLETLRLTTAYDLTELPSFLLTLLAISPRLTRLELTIHKAFSAASDSPLQDMASHLRHLHLDFRSTSILQGGNSGGVTFSFDPFLLACTSLITLHLKLHTSSDLKHIRRFIPAPLTLLCVCLPRPSQHESETNQITSDFADLFDYPCMSTVRRWRFYCEDSFPGGGLAAMQASEEWEAACRAGGIEPRDHRRYFTGESSLGSLSSTRPC